MNILKRLKKYVDHYLNKETRITWVEPVGRNILIITMEYRGRQSQSIWKRVE